MCTTFGVTALLLAPALLCCCICFICMTQGQGPGALKCIHKKQCYLVGHHRCKAKIDIWTYVTRRGYKKILKNGRQCKLKSLCLVKLENIVEKG